MLQRSVWNSSRFNKTESEIVEIKSCLRADAAIVIIGSIVIICRIIAVQLLGLMGGTDSDFEMETLMELCCLSHFRKHFQRKNKVFVIFLK